MTIHVPTPLVPSPVLSRIARASVWLKMEAVQPSGSFKLRGIGAVCERHVAEGKTRFISSSGGNAGIAAAYAGRELSIPVVVVVPDTTPASARTLIRDQGAEVIVHGASWMEANALAESLLTQDDAFLHPFDDPVLWDGHATMIDEVVQACVRPEVVVLSVGGGGLLAGVAEGLRRNGWADIPIIAVETAGAASLAAALSANSRITLETIDTVAKSLGAKQVCERAFELARTSDVRSIVVDDRAAVSASRRFLDDHRLLVEPACGAGLSVVYDRLGAIEEFGSILVIVCGGAVVSVDELDGFLATTA
ncbi:MAG: pyridoxal-phosphate dependent enzyme [Sphingomonadales bacterium]|nr:pyridoxal-phosphate dependent enzyme [Sphingomonadales bacterium]MDE2170782.1 pyridoxal-phosphate dependent enzyme [Sphingomonadales bacterium]